VSGSAVVYLICSIAKLDVTSDNVYEVVNSGPIQATDNFTRVSTDLDRLKLEVFSRKGELLYSAEYVY
jgi:hypothetical protein